MAQQQEQVTLKLNSDQMENLRGIFDHYGWDFNSAITDSATITETAASTCVLVDAETQTDNNDAENNADQSENINEHFIIQQDPNQEECVYCFCRPCITNESNRQLWWESNTHPSHQRNHSLRKEKYKRFWTMMYHRNVWIHQSYIQKKSRALAEDPRFKEYVWHRRDIMPDCVLKLVRHWFPNPRNVPYMGHLWE
jgi:hypothetical protein